MCIVGYFLSLFGRWEEKIQPDYVFSNEKGIDTSSSQESHSYLYHGVLIVWSTKGNGDTYGNADHFF
jgi:hypothetical protein